MSTCVYPNTYTLCAHVYFLASRHALHHARTRPHARTFPSRHHVSMYIRRPITTEFHPVMQLSPSLSLSLSLLLPVSHSFYLFFHPFFQFSLPLLLFAPRSFSFDKYFSSSFCLLIARHMSPPPTNKKPVFYFYLTLVPVFYLLS